MIAVMTAMTKPTRQMLLGALSGALVVALLAGTVVSADEQPGAIDPSKLVRFGDRDYRVEYADWVATDPISSSTVKKIEAGKVSYVSISTTATGTYSTDGLTSRHIRYPGITVEALPATDTSFAALSGGQWLHFSVYRGNSYVSLGNGNVSVSVTPRGTCVSGRSFLVC